MNPEQLLFVEKLRLETGYDHYAVTLLVKKLIELDIFDRVVKTYEANGFGGLLSFIKYVQSNIS